MFRLVVLSIILITSFLSSSAQTFQEILYDGYPLDAKLVAQNPVTGDLAVALENNPVIIWDTKTRQIVREFADVHDQWESIIFSPDGRFLAGSHTSGKTTLYDAATGAVLHTETVGSGVTQLAFSSDSGAVLINGQWVLDTSSYTLSELLDASGTCIGTAGTYVPESDTLITVGSELCLWDASTLAFVQQSDYTFQGNIKAIAASPTGDSVVVTTNNSPPGAVVLNPDGTVRFEVALWGNRGGTAQIDFAEDGSFFVVTGGISAYSGSKAYVVEPQTGQTLAQVDALIYQLSSGAVIYGSAVVEPNTLVLAHGTAGIGIFDLTDARAQAQTLRDQEQASETQAAVDQALEAAKQAQAQEEAERQAAEQQAQAAEAQKEALRQVFDLARNGSVDELAEALGNAGNVDINGTDEAGQTLLMAAAGSNEPLSARFLVNLGADVNKQTSEGWTALMYAARDNTLEMVETLVEIGADVGLTNAESKLASDLASDDAIRDYLNQQLAASQAPAEDEEMVVAAQSANVTDGANTSASGQSQVELTSEVQRLFELARSGTETEITSLLSELSPDTSVANSELLSKTNEDGLTPLMLAAIYNDPLVVLILGAQGQNYNQRTADGWTALMYAAKNGRLDNIEALTTWDLNLLAVNAEGDTFLDVATSDIREELEQRFSGAVRELRARTEAKRPRVFAPTRKQSRVHNNRASALMKNAVGAEFMRAFANVSGIALAACPNADFLREAVEIVTDASYSELNCIVYRGTVQSLRASFDKIPRAVQFIPWQEYTSGAYLAGFSLHSGDNMGIIFDENADMLSFGLVEFN